MTKFKAPRDSWPIHIPPVLTVFTAIAVLILSPFWAARWYNTPFIGALLEPGNVVTTAIGEDWPARDSGAEAPDYLIEAGGVAITNPQSLRQVMTAKGYEPVDLTFGKRDGSTYTIIITPRPVKFSELVTYFIIPYLIGLAFLATGLWAYRTDPHKRSTRAFLIFAAATSVAIASLLDISTTRVFVTGWALSMPVLAAAMIHLGLVFPRQMPFIRKYPSLRFLPWIPVLLLAYPIIQGIVNPATPWSYFEPWRYSYIYGSLSILFFFGMLMARIIRGRSAIARQQSRIIVFGSVLGFSPILLFFFIPVSLGYDSPFQVALFLPPLILFPLSVAYAIVRYRLLDVDRILSSTVTYSVITVGAVGLFYGLITGLSMLLGQQINSNNPLLMAVYLFILVLLLNPLRALTQNAIDRIFYRSRADYGRLLSELSHGLTITPDLARTLRLLDRSLEKALKPQQFILFLYDDDDGVYISHSVRQETDFQLRPESPLIHLLNQNPEPVWFPPGLGWPEALLPEAETLEDLGCRVFVPLTYKGRMIGLLALGPRRAGTPYTSDDLEFLGAVASQSSLSVENVRLFTNLQRTLEETLEMKNLMDDIFASIASGVITTDLQRKITLFNRAAERIFGLEVGKALGKSLPEALHDLWPGRLEAMTNATLSEGASALQEELSPTLSSRGELHLRLSVTPLRDAHRNTMGAAIVVDDLTEQRQLKAEQERIRQTFGRVVAPKVRDRLLSDPASLRLDGIRQPITMLFGDLHNFTAYSEKAEPETMFEVLNSYLSLAAQAILQEEGTLDKFMGDAVMAMWNAPDAQTDHTLRAVQAALAMQQVIQTHRAQQAEAHQLYFSVGITRGDAMVGNVGTDELFNYTAIGDMVNLAQRLEALADPGQILLSGPAYEAVKEQVNVQPLPPVKVKGREQSVTVYELLSLK